MKNFIFLILILFAGSANSQDVDFDGIVFKTKLLDSSTSNSIAKDIFGNNLLIDDNGDGSISAIEAASVYEMNVSNANIPNLVGLERFTNVRKFDGSQNNFTTIDVATLIFLTDLDVSNNSNLITIYAKNGRDESISFGGNNPNLVYICADEFQIDEDIIDFGPGSPNYVVNSYCTASPGGNYNKISGRILFDANSDGIDATDVPQKNVILACNFGSEKLKTVTNDSGQFELNIAQTGAYTFAPVIEHPDWFSMPLPSSSIFTNLNNNNFDQDFVLTPVGVHYDVEVVVVPVSLPNAGTTLQPSYEIVFHNKGNQVQDGQVTFVANASIFSGLVSTTPVNCNIASQNANSLVMNYVGLRPFEQRSFKVILTPTNALIVNQNLALNVTISATGEEVLTQNDNSFTYNQTVVAAPTTTWMKCMEDTILPASAIGQYLHYAINFENTGSQTAKNVAVTTSFDSNKYDLNTLQILSSTYPLDVEVSNGKVLLQNRNANLGGPGGSGSILLKVQTLDNLPVGSTVGTEAEVFFDYENTAIDTAPVVLTTNTATTTFQNLSTTMYTMDSSITAFPNPTSDRITISGASTIKSVMLFDVFGRLLQTNIKSAVSTTLDISQRSSGIYFLKVTSDVGQKVIQVVKE